MDSTAMLVATPATTTWVTPARRSLVALTPPRGGVPCHRDSHINTDNCGAPEFCAPANGTTTTKP